MAERRPPLRIRGVEFPPALVGFARLVFVGLLLALGVSILRHSLGDFWGEADPALSIFIDPTQASARVAVSERLMADFKDHGRYRWRTRGAGQQSAAARSPHSVGARKRTRRRYGSRVSIDESGDPRQS